MTYPPQGGYPDDPANNGPDVNSPYGYPDQGYPDQPAAPQYSPHNGWPDTQPVSGSNPFGGAPASPAPMGGPGVPPPPPMYGPPMPQQSSSRGTAIGWIVGGIAAVVILVVGIVGVFLLTGDSGKSDDSARPGSASGDSSASQSSTPSESPTPTQTPTDVVNDYYDALESHDVNTAYTTLCSAFQGSESDFYGGYTEDEFWEIVDNSTYTVGEEKLTGDDDANVAVKQDIQGGSYDFSADLLIEDGAWKICYWSTPVAA